MKKEAENIHIHTSRLKSSFYITLLFIPSIVFALVLALITTNQPKRQAAMSDSSVLGQELATRKIRIGDKEITVKIADNEITRQRGLSGTTFLSEEEGMLFVFKTKERYSFWMKDMFIPLDIIWIEDSTVMQIHENVPPPEPGTPENRLTFYIPNDSVNYVLEVNAGFANKYGIEKGSILEFVTTP